MTSFNYFGGIDFSGAREPLANLWTAIGREDAGKLRIVSLRPHAFRADLCGYVAGGWRQAAEGEEGEPRVLWGADFAFGIPAAAARHLIPDAAPERAWESLLAWVADRPADEIRNAVPNELRTPRRTDTGGALAPFDLRLYKQTAEGIRWLHALRDRADVSIHPQAPDAGASTSLIEVYPSGAAHELGLPRRRTPARPGEARARAAALRIYLDFADPSLEAIAVTLEDAWDATIACLAAWLCRDDLDQPRRVAANHPELGTEGWIFRPPATLPSR